jgi:hypothetical protein
MFEHVTLLLSFIYVIALTHPLSGATSLILARPRSFLSTASAMDVCWPSARGFDYTPSDCRGWVKATGFRTTALVPLTATESMLIAVK